MAQVIPITITKGFDLQGIEPLDLKTVQDLFTDIVDLTTPYEGIVVYAKDTKNNYQLQGPNKLTDWVQLISSSADFIAISTGIVDAGKPIILDANGKIDASFLEAGTLSDYYRIDGTVPITGTFNAGNQLISNLQDGIFATDAITKQQLDAVIPSGVALDSDQLGGVGAASYLRSDVTDSKTLGNLIFNDDLKLFFGTGQDTSIKYDSTDSYLDVSTVIGSSIKFTEDATVRFSFNMSTGDMTAHDFITTSDITLKRDITKLYYNTAGLSPVIYSYKNIEYDRRRFGFIAQDVKSTHPELVIEEDGMLSVDILGIIPLLVNDVNELKKLILNGTK